MGELVVRVKYGGKKARVPSQIVRAAVSQMVSAFQTRGASEKGGYVANFSWENNVLVGYYKDPSERLKRQNKGLDSKVNLTMRELNLRNIQRFINECERMGYSIVNRTEYFDEI